MGRIFWGNVLLLLLLLSADTCLAATPVAVPQSVTVTANSSVSVTLQAQDAGSSPSYYISAQPTHGALSPTTSALPGNTVIYTPTAGFSGTDSFTFWVSDGPSVSPPATVSITVKDDDFLLTFVTGTLIPIIKQKQDQELQDYINNLTITDPVLQSCFTGSVPQGQTLYELTSFSCQDRDLSQADMTQLGKLVNLQTLDLRYSKLTDISALSNLTKLKSLAIEFNDLTDSSATALSKMTDLEYLNLSFNNFTTTSFLANMNKLTELHLEANEISDISYLEGKTTLKKLWLDDNRFTYIGYLSGLTGLTHLGLGYNHSTSDNAGISNISALQNLTNLQVLVLDGNDITADVTQGTGALTALTGLQKLYLRDNNIEATTNNGLSPIPRQLWVNLQVLTLGFNKIADISILNSFVNLTDLGLEHNQIEDTSALYGLSGLQRLTLDSNKIRKITDATGNGLQNLTGINTCLNLRGNLLLDLTPLANMNNSFALLADDNCLGSIVMRSNIKAFGKYWQFPATRCNDPAVDDKPVAYAQEVTIYQDTDNTITLGGADPEGGAITYTIVSGPSHGQVVSGSFSATAGTFTYRPNADYQGTDSITFIVTETGGKKQTSNQASVQITVQPSSLISDPALQSCFNGSVPDNSTLQSTDTFSCDGHDLSSADLSQLGRLPNLQRVTLLHASLTNISGLASIGANWTFLDLRFNSITNISSALANKTSVVTLGLDDNHISDISILGNMISLQAVYADGNDVSGGGLPSLNNLTYLSLLTLRQSRLLTSDLAAAWGNAVLETDLTIHLDENCLTSKPALPARINIQPVDGAGTITQQRTPNGTVCPSY